MVHTVWFVGFIGFLFLWAIPLGAQEVIDPRSGRLVLTTTDLVVPAGPVTLAVQRSLAAAPNKRGLLGSRWRLNWESRLVRAGRRVLIDEAGRTVPFEPAKRGGGYQAASGERLVFDKQQQALRTRPDGTQERFDAQGRLVARDYRNGNTVALQYGAAGRLAQINGPKGSFLRLTADPEGRVMRVDTSTGATVQYTYGGEALTAVQVNGGPVLRYTYDAKGALSRIDDPYADAVELAYDAKGRVLSRVWADGSQERFEYDAATNRQRRIDAAGGSTTTQWSPDGRQVEVTDPLGQKSVIMYDATRRPLAVTGPTGATARFTYDALGRTVAMEDPLGQVTRLEYVGESAQVQTVLRPNSPRQALEYDSHGNLTAVKLGETTVAALTYHPDGSVATAKGYGAPEQQFTYHPHGRLKSVANALGEATHFEYDPRGNLLRETNPLGGVTLRSYDPQDRLVSLTDAAGATSRYEYDAQGRLSRSIDPSGGETRYEYDARGLLLAETDPADQTTRYEYDAAGRLLRVTEPGPVSEHWRYDAAGRMQEWTDYLGRTTQFDHDPLGRVTAERGVTGLEVRYRYDALGNLLGLEDSAGAKRELQYDTTGQLTATIDPLTATAQYLYDALGNLISLIDPRGQLKDFTYSVEGLLASVREPSGDEGRYEYAAAGCLVAMQRPSGGVTRFSYDAMGNVTGEVDPLGNQWRHTYDTAGRLVSTTDAAGRATQYAYDPLGRLMEKLLPDGKRVTYQYDRLGNLISADDGAFPIRQSYDQTGRLVHVEYPAIKKEVGYEYDGAGLRTKLIDSKGRAIRYEYTTQKSLAAIILPDSKRISVTYDEKDRLQSIRYPNGVAGRWEYDADDRVSKITYADAKENIVGGWTYRYDAAGNLAEQEDHQRHVRRFQYDTAGQLIEAAGPGGTIRYRYGPGGSRATVEAGGTLMQYRHDAADRVIQAGQEQLTHDANGNLITRYTPHGTTGYEFDAEGRLTKIVGPGESIEFGYSPTGERVWRRDRGGLTYFVYDGLDLIEELSETGVSKATYVHGPGIDEPLAMLRDGRTYYYHADRLGSIRLLTDDQGQVAATYDYDAFGNLNTPQGSVPNPFTFTGREWDPGTGLYYYRARYYDPALGQFLSLDPLPAALDEPLEQNPYLYVRNQPLRFVDPLGLAPRSNWLTPEEWRAVFEGEKARADRLADIQRRILRGQTTNELTPHQLARFMRLDGERQRALDNMVFLGKNPPRVPAPPRPYGGLGPGAQGLSSPVQPQPGPLARLWQGMKQGVKGFFGGGGRVRQPTVQVERPGQQPGKSGNTLRPGGRVGAVAIGTSILLGASNTAQASPQDRPRVAIQETTDLASSLASHIAKSWACAKIGGCIAGQPGAAVGGAIPTVVSVIETVVGVGQALVNIVDQLATSDNPPPPPQLLPPPRLEGPTGPPPELPPRPVDDPTSILTPVLPPPTSDQIGEADRQSAPFGTGMPRASGQPREKSGQTVVQQGTAYRSPGAVPPGQPGQEVQLPPGTFNPHGEGPGRFPFPPRGPSPDEPSVRVPHDTLQPGPGMGGTPARGGTKQCPPGCHPRPDGKGCHCPETPKSAAKQPAAPPAMAQQPPAAPKAQLYDCNEMCLKLCTGTPDLSGRPKDCKALCAGHTGKGRGADDCYWQSPEGQRYKREHGMK